MSVDVVIPDGTMAIDVSNGRFQYLWKAQLDDLEAGPWIAQCDAEGRSRSVAVLDPYWDRVVRFVLSPRDANSADIEFRPNPATGFRVRKCWQVDVGLHSGVEVVKELITLQMQAGEATVQLYVIIFPDGRIIVNSSPHV